MNCFHSLFEMYFITLVSFRFGHSGFLAIIIKDLLTIQKLIQILGGPEAYTIFRIFNRKVRER